MPGSFHEELRLAREPARASDRSFGVVLAAVLALVGTAPLWRHGTVRTGALVASGIALALALAFPRALVLPNRIVSGVGRIVGRVVSLVALAVFYFLVIVPAGLVGRLARKRRMPLGPDAAAPTYWVAHPPRSSDTMRDPF